nr:putative ribonuclease H-like domain-containing protein [Tanacetum cinerariifolium]
MAKLQFRKFKDKLLLAQAQEVRVVLNDEQWDFLADTLEEIDDYCDDKATTNAIFMANLSHVVSINGNTVEPLYDSDILSTDVIENRNSFIPAAQTTTNADGTSTTLILGPVTTEEKVQKENDVKARSMLLMALFNEHLMTFNQHKDAKTLFAAIQIRFGGNEAIKKTYKALLKSLPSEWNTHVVFWRNKPDLNTMSFDVLYNNFKIVEQEIKGNTSSSSSLISQNMAFVSSPSSTSEVNTAYRVSTTNTQVSTASTQVSTANLSDATVYAFLANQPNGSQLVHEDLVKIHEDDLEEMDLKWHFNWSYMADDEVPTNMALMAFSDSKGNPQLELQEKGVINSGCSRHMTGNMSYLSEYEEINGGYVAFGGDPKGGKITGKGKISAGKLDFEDVYFVKELKFNLFSVSQMCDKKNNVLFTDIECIVLSPDFKLLDESQVLLRVPRKNNMYSVNLKNIAPSGGLTCLFAKATLDESNLWHKRLGHINFKTMNKLVRGNLVRGLPSKFFENVACQKGKQHKASYKTKSLFDIDTLTKSMNYKTVVAGNQSNGSAGTLLVMDLNHHGRRKRRMLKIYRMKIMSPTANDASIKDNAIDKDIVYGCADDLNMPNLEEIAYSNKDRDVCVEANMTDFDINIHGYTQEEGLYYDEVFAPVARIKAIMLFLSYALFKDFVVYQMDVKSAFLCGKIKEEVYVCQPPRFEDLEFPDRVYKVEKALYGLHQALRAWCQTLSTYLLDNGFHKGQIGKTLFFKRVKGNIILVQVYVDDIIFGFIKKEMCTEFEKMMHKKFQMSSMGKLTFFLGLQVTQKDDGIFISQDKYVDKILKKFGFQL